MGGGRGEEGDLICFRMVVSVGTSFFVMVNRGEYLNFVALIFCAFLVK